MSDDTLKIRNPILPGFNPDPSIIRVGDDYYIATSTFEWFPGVQIHHSRDFVHWRLLTRPLTRASPLKGIPGASSPLTMPQCPSSWMLAAPAFVMTAGLAGPLLVALEWVFEFRLSAALLDEFLGEDPVRGNIAA